MEFSDYEKIGDAIEKAEESVVPFPVVNGEELIVVGDANATEINKHDFKMRFRVPAKKEDGTFEYIWREKEYKDVFIKPRQDARIARMISELMPFYKKIREDGGMESMTREEKMVVFEQLDDEFLDRLYDVTAAVLGIDAELKEYMHPLDVIRAAAQIIELYPETVNEAHTFFK